jgi:metal-responsive CopG/Arc/MetJ family transcriptional regulator
MDASDTPRIITPIPRELLRAIDDFRFSQRLPSRAEAIRQLIEMGLQTTLGDDDKAPYDPGPKTTVKA